VGPPTTEATDDLSPEERKLKLKKERKERLKHLASNRFMLPEEPIKTISFTGENIEEMGEIVEEEEEKNRGTNTKLLSHSKKKVANYHLFILMVG